jgi:hypothetical protein
MDQLLTFLTATATALLSVALLRPRYGGKTAALAAGLFGGLAVFVSYGGAVHVALGGLIALALALHRPSGARFALAKIALAVGAAVAATALPMLVGHDPIESFRTAISTHFSEYTLKRSYRLWLFFNLIDLAVFVSVPIALLVVHRLALALAGLRRMGWWGPRMSVQRAQIATCLLLLLLDLSGVVRGEIGRSWMPIMPFLLLAATMGVDRAALDAEADGNTPDRHAAGPTSGEALALGILLLAHCWVLRICWGL